MSLLERRKSKLSTLTLRVEITETRTPLQMLKEGMTPRLHNLGLVRGLKAFTILNQLVCSKQLHLSKLPISSALSLHFSGKKMCDQFLLINISKIHGITPPASRRKSYLFPPHLPEQRSNALNSRLQSLMT